MGVMDENMSRRYFAKETTGKKREPPDRLSQDSTAAQAAGVSYGKYKAQQYEAAQRTPAPAPKKVPTDPRLKYDLVCHICGRQYKGASKLRKYCSDTCAQTAYIQQKKLREEREQNGTRDN